MTKVEFKQRWESDPIGGGISFDDIADCAKDWGLFPKPRAQDFLPVLYAVLKAARAEDAENYRV